MNVIDPNFIEVDNEVFDVDIYAVGSTYLQEDEFSPTSISPVPIYEHNTEYSGLTPLNIKVNISGYTNWNLGNITIPLLNQSIDFGEATRTIGQLFIVVNNEFKVVTQHEMNDIGISIYLPLGDHTISALYVGKDDDDGIVYATDSVVVRLREIGDTFSTYKSDQFSVINYHTDLTSSGKIQENVTNWYDFADYGKNYDRREYLKPYSSFSLSWENSTIVENTLIAIGNEDDFGFELNSTTNTTGFDGIQLLHEWNSTSGMVFVQDARGLKELNSMETITVREGYNFIGILALSPYGMWHSKIPNLEDGQANSIGFDFEFTEPFYGNDIRNITYDSSFDFLAQVNGVGFRVRLDDTIQTTHVTEEQRLHYPGVSALLLIPLLYRRRVLIWRRIL